MSVPSRAKPPQPRNGVPPASKILICIPKSSNPNMSQTTFKKNGDKLALGGAAVDPIEKTVSVGAHWRIRMRPGLAPGSGGASACTNRCRKRPAGSGSCSGCVPPPPPPSSLPSGGPKKRDCDEESPRRGWSDGTKKRPFRAYSPVFPNPLGDPYGGEVHRRWVQCLRRDYGSTATILYFP